MDGEYKKADWKIEEYTVKGKKEKMLDTVKYTIWGPVVYENVKNNQHADMALRWVVHDEPAKNELRTFLLLNKAKNYNDYSAALDYYSTPAQNYAFACKDGDIALKVNGSHPIRQKGQGRFVQDGTQSANAWRGFIPRDQIPQYRNPARGYISSANQHSTAPNYPYYYFSEGFEPYRGRLVNQNLDTMEDITVEKMKALQNLNYSQKGLEALPNMIKQVDSTRISAAEKMILDKLKTWNYYYDADKEEAAVFELWFDKFYEATWDEVTENENAKNIMRPTEWRTVFLLRDAPNNKYFDVKKTPGVETAKDLLTSTFQRTCEELVKLRAEKLAQKSVFNWTTCKDTEIPHMARMAGFGRQHLPNGGQADCINSVKKSHGPSWRMIVEMDSVPRAFITYPGGASGNAGSPRYDQYVDTWVQGKYYEAVFLQKKDLQDKRIKSVQTFEK